MDVLPESPVARLVSALKQGAVCSAAAHAQAASLETSQQAMLQEELLKFFEEPPEPGAKRRRLRRSCKAPPATSEHMAAWLPATLAAALARLPGALPRDQGLCVLPHPHRLEKKTMTTGECCLTISGLAFQTNRACDNCDRSIEEQSWFACAEGCEVDFCVRCHERLQQLFEGRDLRRALWAAEFLARGARALLAAPQAARQAFVEILAFEWPLQMFQDLVRAVVDVADAKVVHIQDATDMDVAADVDFWHLLGLLQLLRCANQLPAQEQRFGELTRRGCRVPESDFVLGGIDKCDAQADWLRWKTGAGSAAPEQLVLKDKFQVGPGFTAFLAHGSLVPPSFRQRCLDADLDELISRSKPLHCAVPRSPARKLRVAAVTGLLAAKGRLLVAHFVRERGRGAGVAREFLAKAAEVLMTARSGASMEEGQPLWDYEAESRTFWFAELPPSKSRRRLFEACGVLLAQALVTGTRLQVSFPPVLYSLLLRHLGASAPEPGLEELAMVRPCLAKGLQQLLEYQGPDAGEVFPLDWPRGDELCSENRREHVEAFVRWFFDEKFESQLRPLAEGFQSVLGGSNLLKELVTAPQLEQFLCGVEAPMDLRQLRQSARFLGFDQAFEELFWSVLEELDAEQRRRFAVFVSACGRRPPEGWHKFDLQVQRNGEGDERLPTAYTCFTLLLLPRYSSAQVMRARLLAAINETEGFGLS